MIDFDPKKDATNRRKHGISLGAAERMFADDFNVIETEDRSADEPRLIAFGLIDANVFCCIFMWREDKEGAPGRRIISLRPATRSEAHAYFTRQETSF